MGGLALSRPLPPPPRPPVDMERFGSEAVERLCGVALEVSRQGMALVSWVDHDRARAKTLGVETVAIELGALVESEGFIRAKEALEGSRGEECELTSSGLDRLRRAERLWHEAQAQLRRNGLGELTIRSPELGSPASEASDPLRALVIIGGLAIGAVLLLGLFGGGGGR